MKRKFIGSRIWKTAIAVFLTALICELLDITAAFAVIAAIVTIEPTVNDSIRKGLIRLPASAIGAAYAVLLLHFFGPSPISYTLAAFLTILTCYKLKLHAGLLVATITAVAMIDVLHAHLFLGFVTRLGGTVIGITVSTLVNIFIFPPNYLQDIQKQMQLVITHTADMLDRFVCRSILEESSADGAQDFQKVTQERLRLNEMIHQQLMEERYHVSNQQTKETLTMEIKQTQILQQIHYHLWNLIQAGENTGIAAISWDSKQRATFTEAAAQISDHLINWQNPQNEAREQQMQALFTLFWKIKMPAEQREQFFPPETIFLYELLSIHQLVEAFTKNADKVQLGQ